MVDPIFTYVGGIAFLVLIIVPMLYLMANNPDYEDESPGESVVGGVGTTASETNEEEPADESEEPEAETEEAEEETETEESRRGDR